MNIDPEDNAFADLHASYLLFLCDHDEKTMPEVKANTAHHRPFGELA